MRLFLATPQCRLPLNRDTHLLPTAQKLISSSDNNNIRAAHWADQQWNAEWADSPTKLRIFIPDTGSHPPSDHLKKSLGTAQPPPHWCRAFPLLLVQMGYGLCGFESGVEEQTVDHVVLQCPIHRPPHGLHGLTVQDDETIEWLLNTCAEI